jgi:hypothetical protein
LAGGLFRLGSNRKAAGNRADQLRLLLAEDVRNSNGQSGAQRKRIADKMKNNASGFIAFENPEGLPARGQ